MAVDVSIVSCKSYDAEECRLALEQALAPFGGLDWVKDGMRVVIKVNLVSAMKPEQAATTHPALLCELTKMLRARGASVLLGDSPGGLYTAAHVNHVYDLSGMHACEAVGAELNQDFSQADASFPDAVCAKKFAYTAYLDQADAIIDFCKLKTHGMMGLTNAVKNYFGVIPGTMKPEYHYKYPQISDFSNMLIDLSTYFKPRICICDAVVGMEGNGPTQGSPRAIGAVLAAESASKLDLLAAKLIGLTADDVPTLQAARVRGLIPQTAEELHHCRRTMRRSSFRISRPCPPSRASFSTRQARALSAKSSTASCSMRLRPVRRSKRTTASAAASAQRSVRRRQSGWKTSSPSSTARRASTASAVRSSARRAQWASLAPSSPGCSTSNSFPCKARELSQSGCVFPAIPV